MALLIRLVAWIFLAVVFVPQAAAEEPAPGSEKAKRKTLWTAFRKAKTKEIGEIDTYGENPSLTAICFSAKGQVYLFTMKEDKVAPLTFQKGLPTINRITFSEGKRLKKSDPEMGAFVLWADGEAEMIFAADK